MTKKTYQPYAPKQSLLLPASPQDWLPEGHLAYFVMDVVKELDLGPIHRHYARELRRRERSSGRRTRILRFE